MLNKNGNSGTPSAGSNGIGHVFRGLEQRWGGCTVSAGRLGIPHTTFARYRDDVCMPNARDLQRMMPLFDSIARAEIGEWFFSECRNTTVQIVDRSPADSEGDLTDAALKAHDALCHYTQAVKRAESDNLVTPGEANEATVLAGKVISALEANTHRMTLASRSGIPTRRRSILDMVPCVS